MLHMHTKSVHLLKKIYHRNSPRSYLYKTWLMVGLAYILFLPRCNKRNFLFRKYITKINWEWNVDVFQRCLKIWINTKHSFGDINYFKHWDVMFILKLICKGSHRIRVHEEPSLLDSGLTGLACMDKISSPSLWISLCAAKRYFLWSLLTEKNSEILC